MFHFVKNIDEIGDYAHMYKDDVSGIVIVNDGRSGMSHSVHPNIHHSGSAIGMKKIGYWKKTDKIVKAGFCKYNISSFVCDYNDPFDRIVADECMCEGCRTRRSITV